MLGLPVWAGVIVLVAGILVVQALAWMAMARPVRRRLAAARSGSAGAPGGGPALREGTVRSLGELSRGRTQARGVGHLSVTDDEIVFVLAVPHRTLRIPRDAVGAVEEVRTHLGKWVGKPLLRVWWVRDDGTADAIAFDVGRDRAAWRELLGG